MTGVGERVIGEWAETLYRDMGYMPSLDGSVLMERLIDEAVAEEVAEAMKAVAQVLRAIEEYGA